MFKPKKQSQSEMILYTMDELVPQNHLLRKIKTHIDFSFINPMCEHLYSRENGRNCVEPEILFKMVLIQHLFGIKSFRQTCKEIEVNVAYRWFIDCPFTEKVPDHSTYSQNLKRRFLSTTIFEDIFSEILHQAIQKRLISGQQLFTDSTHIKANANKRKGEKMIEESVKRRRESLEKEINQEREKLGKKPIEFEDEIERKEIKRSLTDPDSGYYHRSHKEEGFMYLDHRSVDGKYNLIVDAYITKGNVHDSQPYLERLQYLEDKYQLKPQAVGLDSGYYSYEIIENLEEKGIFGVIGYRRFGSSKSEQKQLKKVFKYDEQQDVYVCPLGVIFPLRNVNKQGYKIYHKKENCLGCPMAQQCLKGKAKIEIRRHIKQPIYDQNRINRLSDRGKELYTRRKETVERSFADSKQNHGYRYATYRGLDKVQASTWLSCAAQNMKKIALIMANREAISKKRDAKEAVSLKLVDISLKINLLISKFKSRANYEATLSTVSTIRFVYELFFCFIVIAQMLKNVLQFLTM